MGSGALTPGAGSGALAGQFNAQAEKLIDEKRWGEALEVARQAVTADPLGARGWWNAGRALVGLERYSEALETLLEAQAHYPDFVPEISLALAQTYEALGSTGRAAELYRLVGQYSTTKEALDLLQRLEQRFGSAGIPTWYADLDGDGRTERVEVTGKRIRALAPTGAVIHDESIPGQVTEPLAVEVWNLDGGQKLVHISWFASSECTAAVKNRFISVRSGAATVHDEPVCTRFAHLGGNLAEAAVPEEDPVYKVRVLKWNGDRFEAQGEPWRGIRNLYPHNALAALNALVSGQVDKPAEVFASEGHRKSLQDRIQSRPGALKLTDAKVSVGGGVSVKVYRGDAAEGTLHVLVRRGKIRTFRWDG